MKKILEKPIKMNEPIKVQWVEEKQMLYTTQTSKTEAQLAVMEKITENSKKGIENRKRRRLDKQPVPDNSPIISDCINPNNNKGNFAMNRTIPAGNTNFNKERNSSPIILKKKSENSKYPFVPSSPEKTINTNPLTNDLSTNSLAASFSRTKKSLKAHIRANFFGGENEFFLTLTTRKKIYDHTKFKDALKNWFKALKKKTKDIIHSYKVNNPYFDYTYITIFEPHADSSWHAHVLFKYHFSGMHKITDNGKSFMTNLFITMNKDSRRAISNVQFQSIHDIELLANYLCSHMTDLYEEDDITITEKGFEGKKFEKNARLRLYPLEKNKFSCSTNCTKPVFKTYDSLDEILTDYEILSIIEEFFLYFEFNNFSGIQHNTILKVNEYPYF